MTCDAKFMDAVLDPAVTTQELERCARGSSQFFVRSLDQLAEDSPPAAGRRLAALEALRTYGREILAEVAAEGAALLSESPSAAGRVLRQRRELLNLEPRQVATRAGVDQRVLQAAEQSRRVPIRECERIARSLGLDERFLSARGEPTANERVAVRLRTIGDEHPRMTGAAVSAIAEAAWVAGTQIRLETWLDLRPPSTCIEPSWNYGGPGYPTYMQGYYLAQGARLHLNLGTGPLPRPLREICEDRLGIPVIQAELGEALAGATVEMPEGRRAIVLNLGGKNRNVYVRRATVAHELGHLLYDPSPRLNDLRVDDFDALETFADQLPDAVEQRANAFAVEFLAPQAAALDCFRAASSDGVGAVMDLFGVSFTVARYQLWNGMDRKTPLERLTATPRHPDTAFEAQEAYTVDYHPVPGIPISRAGRFSGVVLRAAEEKMISWQTATEYLCCSEADLRAAASSIRDLFPNVFPAGPSSGNGVRPGPAAG